MGKVCTSCGADIDMPQLPDHEDELCDDCQAAEGTGDLDSQMGADDTSDEDDDM